MTTSTRWSLPLLAAAPAQKETTHNEAIMAIDRLLQLAVVSRTASKPPADAAPGDVHIVGPLPLGAWADSAGHLSSFDGAGWTMTTPQPGCLAWVADEQTFAVLACDGWSSGGWPVSGLRIGDRHVLAMAPQPVTAPFGGSTVDLECRSALVALLGALRDQGVIV